jgi:hypothetical protein
VDAVERAVQDRLVQVASEHGAGAVRFDIEIPKRTVFPDPRLVAAIVDRVTFNAHILETGTQSYRLRTTKSGTARSRKPS